MSLQSIPVTLIEPHPKNPRRELGDLTELADSIRAQGVRQNLLVVPVCTGCPDVDQTSLKVKDDGTSWCTRHKREGRLRVVIGHRRLAAAKLAGLAEVPAVIDEGLSPAEQLELMLVENVQRSDLSPVEEAEGYQGLLDLGVPVTMIAKKTGRSATTVRSRVKLLALPDEAREKVHTGQATLEDAATVEEYANDPEYSERLANALGTDNFDWLAKRAADYRKHTEKRDKLVAKLVKLGATEAAEERTGYAVVHHWYTYDLTIPKGFDMPEGAIVVAGDHVVTLYRPKTEAELSKDDKSEAAKARRKAAEEAAALAQAALEQERATAVGLREDFCRGLLARKRFTKDETYAILAAFVPRMVAQSLGGYSLNQELEDLDIDLSDVPEEAILVYALHVSVGQHRWGGAWARVHEDDAVRALYRLLGQLGYTLSDAERARIFPDEATS